MKLPTIPNGITLFTFPHGQLYPPSGFIPFNEYALGNGDYFGLYWPVGREIDDPLVVETWHDSGEISPCYSNLAAFLAHCQRTENANRPVDAMLSTDPLSPLALYHAGKHEIHEGNVDTAISLLEQAISILPEYGAALTALCGQYRRKGHRASAIRTAHAAIITPPSFGGMQAQIVQWFQHQHECPEEMHNDPLWINRTQLSTKFGGLKENETYHIFQEAIAWYASIGLGWNAIVLHMAYGELMLRETVSFHERYRFDCQSHHEALSQLIIELGYQQRTLDNSREDYP